MNYRDFLQKVIYKMIDPLVRVMVKAGITPNMVTATGFLGNLAASALFVWGAVAAGRGDTEFMWVLVGGGGAVVLVSGLFDMVDGRLARKSGTSSVFGALWDSVLDRYSELVSLFGVMAVFVGSGWLVAAVVTGLAVMGSMMVSYVRARAEGLGLTCGVGLLQRPERVVITALAAIAAGTAQSMWWLAGGMTVIAVFANLTAVWRIVHCYRSIRQEKKE